MDVQQDDTQTQSRAALTIVIHSWATPIVGVFMLAIGLLGGYFGRPLVSPQSPSSSATSQPAETSSGDPSDTQNQPSDPNELMAFVISQTRHFKGDPNAPVTIIEFSDFQ